MKNKMRITNTQRKKKRYKIVKKVKKNKDKIK